MFLTLTPIHKIEVNHKDGIKHHNYDTNLEWCTKKENQQHEADVLKQRNCEKHWGTILTEEKVIEIYNLCKERNLLYKDIAKLYGIFPQEVSDIAQGKLWRDLELEPLPPLIRGSRRTGKRILWINENKEYSSINKCTRELRNTYNLIITKDKIRAICNGVLNEYKNQQFRFLQ